MNDFEFLYTWDEWDTVLTEHDGICFRCSVDVGDCSCYTWQVVEAENLPVVKINERHWVDLRSKNIMTTIVSTPEYQTALKEFNDVNDRPVCLFLSSEDKSLKERIQVLDLENGQDKEENKEGMIILVCFNEIVKVQRVDEVCDCCGCLPCDCDWGN